MRSFAQKVFPYLLLAPTLVIFGLFLFFPAVNGLWISLTKWDGVNPQKFIGIQNYVKLLSDISFWGAFFRAVFYWPTMISTIIVGLTWRFLLGEDFGVINYLLTYGGRDPVKWLTDENYAMGGGLCHGLEHVRLLHGHVRFRD